LVQLSKRKTMGDLDNLVTIANSGKYPNLFNSSDVDNIRGIVDVYSDIASNNVAQS